MLIGAANFKNQFQLFRTCWIKGRVRGGKTLLAVVLAHEFHRDGVVKGVVCNIPNALPVHPWDSLRKRSMDDDQGGSEPEYLLGRECFYLYDEPWVKLDNRTSMSNDRSYNAFLGKNAAYMALPSVVPIDKRLSYLSVQCVSRFSMPLIKTPLKKIFGLLDRAKGKKWPIGVVLDFFLALLTPLRICTEQIRVYRWRYEQGDQSDTGTFWLCLESRYYHLFDTEFKPVDDADIGELINRTLWEDKKHDIGPGTWWQEAEDFGDPYGYTPRGQGWSSNGTEDPGADPDYQTEIHSIKYPFFGRPTVTEEIPQ